MQNKDLSRFFPVNRASKKANQFVRYDENGNIEGVSGAIIEQNLLDPDFVPIANTYYKHIGPTGGVYNLTISITGGTIDNEFTKIDTVSELSFIVIPENDYTLPTSITVVNATYSYDNITGKITLSNPTADVVVNVVCESTSPKPVGLNPWVVDRSYEIGSGDKFLFDTSTDPLEFLKSLETAGEGGTSLYSDGIYSLVSSGSPDYAAIVLAMVISGKYFLLGNIGTGMYGYVSDDFNQEGISFKKGWNCPENGIVEVTSNVGHVGELSPITGWNGVFTGFEKKQS